MRFRLTKAGRMVIFALLAVVLCVGAYFGYQHFAPADLIDKFESDTLVSDTTVTSPTKADVVTPNISMNDTTINLSLDEWIG